MQRASSTTRSKLSASLKHLLWLAPVFGVVLFAAYATAASDTQVRMHQTVNGQSTAKVSVVYSSPGRSWDRSSGIVVGVITDQAQRDRVLSQQPFDSCPAGCTDWQPVQQLDYASSSLIKPTSFYPPQLSPGAVAAPHVLQALTDDSNLRCATRYSPKDNPTPEEARQATGRDVYCLSPDSGGLVYGFLE